LYSLRWARGSFTLPPNSVDTEPLEEASQEEIARFMSFVEKLPNGCWFWTGARSRGGGNRKWYGSFRRSSKNGKKGAVVRAHVFACHAIDKKPPLPPGHDRDHLCKFSLCIRPEHFEIVTKEINQQRRHAKDQHVPEMHFDA
jgi:hypothetical protein